MREFIKLMNIKTWNLKSETYKILRRIALPDRFIESGIESQFFARDILKYFLNTYLNKKYSVLPSDQS
jgi:predicted nuclease of restriction endonuclease-like RecB superfamily